MSVKHSQTLHLSWWLTNPRSNMPSFPRWLQAVFHNVYLLLLYKCKGVKLHHWISFWWTSSLCDALMLDSFEATSPFPPHPPRPPVPGGTELKVCFLSSLDVLTSGRHLSSWDAQLDVKWLLAVSIISSTFCSAVHPVSWGHCWCFLHDSWTHFVMFERASQSWGNSFLVSDVMLCIIRGSELRSAWVATLMSSLEHLDVAGDICSGHGELGLGGCCPLTQQPCLDPALLQLELFSWFIIEADLPCMSSSYRYICHVGLQISHLTGLVWGLVLIVLVLRASWTFVLLLWLLVSLLGSLQTLVGS